MNIKPILAKAAIVAVGTFGAFAFTPRVSKDDTTAQYYVNSAGAPIELVSGDNECNDAGGSACSKEFTLVNGQPDQATGANIHTGIRE